MKLLAVIRDTDLGLLTAEPCSSSLRHTARAVVFDATGNIALLLNAKRGYHKLPGGGVEKGEDFIAALRREAMEEIGCAIDNIRELAMVEEYRNELATHQISHCFIADVHGNKQTPNFTQEELADGFKIVWLPIDEALATLENEMGIEDYEGKFINARELLFLKEAKSFITS